MTWPTSDVNTDTIDQGTDVPNVSRGELNNTVNRFNEIRNHFTQTIIDLCVKCVSAVEARKALKFGTSGFLGRDSVINGFSTGTFRSFAITSIAGEPTNFDGGFDVDAGTYTAVEPGMYLITVCFSVPKRAGGAGVCQNTMVGVVSSFLSDYMIKGNLFRYPTAVDGTTRDYQQVCTLQYLSPGEVIYVRLIENTASGLLPPVYLDEFSAMRLT